MYRTLSELKSRVDSLIEQQGEDAPCASFIFTQMDVYYFEDDCGDELFVDDNDTIKVLKEVGDSDYIYSQIDDLIGNEIRTVRVKEE